MTTRDLIDDGISNEDVQRLKGSMEAKVSKTVNTVLAVLSRLLKTAVEWDVIERLPCSIELLQVQKDAAADFMTSPNISA
jgi:hypothetical protein